MTEETMITATTHEKQQHKTYYCEVCGLDASPKTNLERLGKLSCTDTHDN